ncbi:hypothetical protein HDU92_008231 [Lobulomyces angularis]|nr:hypothetical protein HDU92_008231 [Lobulomyces angularis]
MTSQINLNSNHIQGSHTNLTLKDTINDSIVESSEYPQILQAAAITTTANSVYNSSNQHDINSIDRGVSKGTVNKEHQFVSQHLHKSNSFPSNDEQSTKNNDENSYYSLPHDKFSKILSNDAIKNVKSPTQMHSVVFSGYLQKENRRKKFQRRLIRCDGILLVCLSPKKIKLPDGLTMALFNPLTYSAADEFLPMDFLNMLKKLYPTYPAPIIQLMSPLIAAISEEFGDEDEYGIPDSKSKYFLMPKWVIPLSSIKQIRSIVQQPAKEPESKKACSFVVRTSTRDYLLRAEDSKSFFRWTFLLSRLSESYSEELDIDINNNHINDNILKSQHFAKKISVFRDVVNELVFKDLNSTEFILPIITPYFQLYGEDYSKLSLRRVNSNERTIAKRQSSLSVNSFSNHNSNSVPESSRSPQENNKEVPPIPEAVASIHLQDLSRQNSVTSNFKDSSPSFSSLPQQQFLLDQQFRTRSESQSSYKSNISINQASLEGQLFRIPSVDSGYRNIDVPPSSVSISNGTSVSNALARQNVAEIFNEKQEKKNENLAEYTDFQQTYQEKDTGFIQNPEQLYQYQDSFRSNSPYSLSINTLKNIDKVEPLSNEDYHRSLTSSSDKRYRETLSKKNVSDEKNSRFNSLRNSENPQSASNSNVSQNIIQVNRDLLVSNNNSLLDDGSYLKSYLNDYSILDNSDYTNRNFTSPPPQHPTPDVTYDNDEELLDEVSGLSSNFSFCGKHKKNRTSKIINGVPSRLSIEKGYSKAEHRISMVSSVGTFVSVAIPSEMDSAEYFQNSIRNSLSFSGSDNEKEFKFIQSSDNNNQPNNSILLLDTGLLNELQMHWGSKWHDFIHASESIVRLIRRLQGYETSQFIPSFLQAKNITLIKTSIPTFQIFLKFSTSSLPFFFYKFKDYVENYVEDLNYLIVENNLQNKKETTLIFFFKIFEKLKILVRKFECLRNDWDKDVIQNIRKNGKNFVGINFLPENDILLNVGSVGGSLISVVKGIHEIFCMMYL